MKTSIKIRGALITRSLSTSASFTFGAAYLVSALLQPALAGAAAEKGAGAKALMEVTRTPSFYELMRSEQDVPELKELVKVYASLPQMLQKISTTFGTADPVGVGVYQCGYGTNDELVVFVHGILATHDTWRYVVGALGPENDYLLIDLPGCGLSDKPAPNALPEGSYNPKVLADRLLQVLEKTLAHRPQPPRITLVGHSFGGMVVLRMQSDPDLRQRHADVLRRIDQTIVFAPCDVGVRVKLPTLAMVESIKGVTVSFGSALGVLRSTLAKVEVAGKFREDYATREGVDALVRAFTHGEERHATQSMIRQAVPGWDKTGKPDSQAIRALETAYRNIDTPVLIVWGAEDDTLPEWMAHKIKDHVPGARLVELPECKHSPHTEFPTVCADLIRNFRAEVAADKQPPRTGPIAAAPVSGEFLLWQNEVPGSGLKQSLTPF